MLNRDVAMKFAFMEEFKKVVRDYGIRERCSIHFIKMINNGVKPDVRLGAIFNYVVDSYPMKRHYK